MTSINSLPSELLVHIFKFLNQENLEFHVIPVCRLWKELVAQFIPWKLELSGKQVIRGSDHSLKNLRKIGIKVLDVTVNFTPKDDRIRIFSAPEPIWPLGDFNSAFPDLQKLHVTSSHVNVERIDVFNNLQHLSIDSSQSSYAIRRRIAKSSHILPEKSYTTFLKHCPQLKILDIDKFCLVSPELTSVIASLEKLESLRISLCHKADIEAVLAPLHSHPALKKLSLCFHGNEKLLDSTTFLSTLPSLESLSVDCEFVSKTNAMEFFKKLPSRLTEFNFTADDTYLEEDNIQQIYQTLPNLRFLKLKCSEPIREEGKYNDFINGRQVELQLEYFESSIYLEDLQDFFAFTQDSNLIGSEYHAALYSSVLESLWN